MPTRSAAGAISRYGRTRSEASPIALEGVPCGLTNGPALTLLPADERPDPLAHPSHRLVGGRLPAQHGSMLLEDDVLHLRPLGMPDGHRGRDRLPPRLGMREGLPDGGRLEGGIPDGAEAPGAGHSDLLFLTRE